MPKKPELTFPLSGYHKEIKATNKHSIFEFVEMNKMYSVAMPTSISEQTRLAIAAKVLEEVGVVLSMEDTAPFGWMGVADKSSGLPYQGSFLKRLMSYLWKEHQKNLSQQTLTSLGNVVGKELSTAGMTHFKFDPIANYIDGQFGDTSSCFWSIRTGARMIIRNEGGAFIEFFDNPDAYLDNCMVKNGKGVGRCWIIPADQFMNEMESPAFILCNAYSDVWNSKYTAIRAVSTLLGMTYKNVSAHANISDTFYLNGDCGYLMLSNPADYEKVPPEGIQFNFSLEYRGQHDPELQIGEVLTCNSCGRFKIRSIDPDIDTRCHRLEDGSIYCNDCYNRYFSACPHCGKEILSIELISCGSKRLCPDCAHHAGFHQCVSCGNWRSNTKRTEDEDGHICLACRNAGYRVECPQCGLFVRRANLVRTHGEYSGCVSCYKKEHGLEISSCANCGNIWPSSEMNQYHLCPDCKDRLVVCDVCHARLARQRPDGHSRCSQCNQRS